MKNQLTMSTGAIAAAITLFTGVSAQAVVVEVGTEVGNGEDAALYNDGGLIGQSFSDTAGGGGSNSMDARLLTGGVFTERFRAGIVRMDLSGVTENFADLASAGLKIQNASQQREIIVYGLNDGDAGESWDASTIDWNTAPGLVPNPTYADVVSTAGQVDTGRWTELGYWEPMGPGSGGTTTEFSTTYLSTDNPAGWTDAEAGFADEYGGVDPLFDDNLVNFLQADTDGQVSLLFMISERLGPANGGLVAIRTQEWVLNPVNAAAALTTPTIVMDFIEAEPLVGDLNGDGFVGIIDLNIVLSAWNQNVPPANPLADPSGDGFVGIDDLNAVLGNWNAGTPPTNGAAIPEPATVALLGMGGLVLSGRRR